MNSNEFRAFLAQNVGERAICSFSDEKEYYDFLTKTLPECKEDLLAHDGVVGLKCEFSNHQTNICGSVPAWKEYGSKADFESYYKRSEMMRDLYCNEEDYDAETEERKDVKIFISVPEGRFSVVWTTKGDEDVFTYRPAKPEEIGTLWLVWDVIGGTVDENDERLFDKHIVIICDKNCSIKDFNNIKSYMSNVQNMFSIKDIAFK